VTGPVPTKFGDVLILYSPKTGMTHAVGLVVEDGQQDLSHGNLEYIAGRAAADLKAKSLGGHRGARVFLVNTENSHWTEVAP
jgi:hypothetical protein